MKGNSFKMIVCQSDDVDTKDAAEELIAQADEQLDGEIPNACILFAAIDYEHQIFLDIINNKWKGIKLIGGTTDGEISSNTGFSEDSVVMMLFYSSKIRFSTGIGVVKDSDISGACKNAVDQALSDFSEEVKLCITIPGNITTNIDQIMFNLRKMIKTDIPIFGGVAGDQWRFQTQYQFLGTNVYTDAVPVLMMGGDVEFVYGIDSGWEPMGNFGLVTKAEGNIVYNIDNETALDFYKNNLGELSTPSAEFPLIVFNENNEVLYQRSAASVMEGDTGAIIFMGEIPQGSKVKIGGAERNVILNGTTKSVSNALDKLSKNSQIIGGLLFSCAARKTLLGTKTNEESKIVTKLIGEKIPYIGFYAYGELSPVKGEEKNSMLHNQTFVTLLFVTH